MCSADARKTDYALDYLATTITVEEAEFAMYLYEAQQRMLYARKGVLN